MILTAGYILWAMQRVYLGAEYKGPHPEALTPMTLREFSIAAPLLALAIFFGVYPQALLNYMQPSVNKTVVELTEWTKTHDKRAAATGTARQPSNRNRANEFTTETQRHRESICIPSLCPLCLRG